MTDYFALLEVSRSPWLDGDDVKARFASLSGPLHPDRVHQADAGTRSEATRRYAELNAAWQCLGDTRRRLRHLLELETGRPPDDVGAVPPQISDLFFQVGQALRTADELVRRRQAAVSPIVQAQLMRQALGGVEDVRRILGELESRREGLDERCRRLNQTWNSGALPVEELAELHRDYSFVNRWMDQLRERLLQLTL